MAVAFAPTPVTSLDGFAAFYEANIDAVYSYARHRVGADEAEDVSSDVFHAALRTFRSGGNQRMTTAWLLSVTRNKVIDRWRASGRHRAKAHLLRPADHELFDLGGDIDVVGHSVLQVLDELDPRYRKLLVLRYVHGYPVRAMAKDLGETPSAIESALKRARLAFRDRYSEVRQ